MKRFFALPGNISETTIRLDKDETHHLRDVMRLVPGDEILVFDGEGLEYRCRISQIDRDEAQLDIIEIAVPAAPESPFELTLAVAVLKGDKSEFVVQKAVEVGVTKIIPLITARCVVKMKETPKRIERWRRIALEATKQCGRARLMSIADPITFEELVAAVEPASTIMFSERDGKRLSFPQDATSLTAIFGPEGGWNDAELELAEANGVNFVTLGGRILRAETAAISFAAIIQHHYGDLN